MWFIITPLVYFNLCKILVSGFLQLKGDFAPRLNDLKYRHIAASSHTFVLVFTELVTHCKFHLQLKVNDRNIEVFGRLKFLFRLFLSLA